MNTIEKKILYYPIAIVGGGPVGVFLSHLLTFYDIKHCLIEKRKEHTSHPQAHFMNARTMEILRSYNPSMFQEIISATPPSKQWRSIYMTKKYVHLVVIFIVLGIFLIATACWEESFVV